jgi:hypothetical protein
MDDDEIEAWMIGSRDGGAEHHPKFASAPSARRPGAAPGHTTATQSRERNDLVLRVGRGADQGDPLWVGREKGRP